MKQITFAPRNHLLTNTNTWTRPTKSPCCCH
ncbi:hypothetical protein O5833_29990, partial [Escherichia coli]|nr:hypothetical protein [Escherichia coli]